MPTRPYSISLYATDGRRKYLTGPEREAFLLAALSHPRRDVGTFCLLIALCGCRISEALSVTAASCSADEGVVAFRSLKKRNVFSVRQVPAPAFLIARLLELAQKRPGRLWSWSRFRAWQLVREVMVMARISDGPHATARGLRHGFGVHAVRSGIPLNMIQKWLGHASLSTTSIYTNLLGPEEREMASRMWLPALKDAVGAPTTFTPPEPDPPPFA